MTLQVGQAHSFRSGTHSGLALLVLQHIPLNVFGEVVRPGGRCASRGDRRAAAGATGRAPYVLYCRAGATRLAAAVGGTAAATAAGVTRYARAAPRHGVKARRTQRTRIAPASTAGDSAAWDTATQIESHNVKLLLLVIL